MDPARRSGSGERVAPSPNTSSLRARRVLLGATFAIAVSGLIYELLAGAVSSYLVGDSVFQFSIVIGLFMSAMGLGSFLSRYVKTRQIERFVQAQIVIGVLGGFSAILLYAAFAMLESYLPVLVAISVSIGALIGLEIPLVIQILKTQQTGDESVSDVLTLDYIGALAASLLFPLVLLPYLGLARSGLLFGLVNVSVAALGIWTFRREIANRGMLACAVVAAAALLMTGFAHAQRISTLLEDSLYSDEVILRAQTAYQRVTLTRNGDELRMFINGSIQFDSRDEYRYHESLVHPALMSAPARRRVLIIGGGDGLATREILKYRDVEEVVLVDIDAAITEMFTNNALLRDLNRDALRDSRVKVVNQDAWKFLEQAEGFFDVVLIDLPDPHDISLSRLYSRSFYRLIATRLSASGVIVSQATSPLYARAAFWCVQASMDDLELPTAPGRTLQAVGYHAYVPSFGEWGFVLATPRPVDWRALSLDVPTRFLTSEVLAGMTTFPSDMSELSVEPNTLDRHELVTYYREGWDAWQN